jgi:hypothetical protein
MRIRYLISFVSLFLPLSVRAADSGGLECIARLDIPLYTVFSRSASLEGTAQAAVHLDSGGKPNEVDIEGVHNILKREISEKLYGSTYRPECAKKVIRLRFLFILEGKATTGCSRNRASFQPPDTFVIVTNPMDPIID